VSTTSWKKCVLLLLLAPAIAGAAPVTVDEAISTALDRNATILALRAEIQGLRAQVRGTSRLVRSNPEIAGAFGPRRSPGEESTTDLEVSLSQELEIFGQRSARRDAAAATLAAAEGRLESRRVEVAAEVRTAFARALADEQRLAVADESLGLAKEELQAAEQRLRSGATSRMEVNAALAAVGRAARERAAAVQRRSAAYGRLVVLTGVDPGEPLELAGELSASAPGESGRDANLEKALERRADIAAARRDVDAARAEGRLAARSALPSPRVGVSYAEEGDPRGDAQIVQGTLAFDLPLFNRNQEERGAAAARERQAELALAALIRAARGEVTLAVARLEAANDATRAWTGGPLEAVAENMRLVDEAYRAGKVDFFQLLLIRRETLEARNGYVDALEELHAAQAELLRATGSIE
jgi:cobalt-zinc-cadmium efflux system outer membrane protein